MEVFEDIKARIKKNPALGIVLAVVVIGLIVYLRNRVSAASAASATPASTAPTGFAPATGGYTLVENIHQMPGPTPVAPVPPAPKPVRTGTGKNYIGPNPWLQPPPPSVAASSWNPYQYNTTVPTANQWPRPNWYNSWWGAGHTSPPPGAR